MVLLKDAGQLFTLLLIGIPLLKQCNAIGVCFGHLRIKFDFTLIKQFVQFCLFHIGIAFLYRRRTLIIGQSLGLVAGNGFYFCRIVTFAVGIILGLAFLKEWRTIGCKV